MFHSVENKCEYVVEHYKRSKKPAVLFSFLYIMFYKIFCLVEQDHIPRGNIRNSVPNQPRFIDILPNIPRPMLR